MRPNEDQALQFAIMLQSGLPASSAILYFTDSEDPAEVGIMLRNWLRSKLVKDAQKKLLGKSWSEMSLDERCEVALNQHYAGMSFMLYSTHYAEATSADKLKLDEARKALEARRAGTQGQLSPLDQFLRDFQMEKRSALKSAPPLSKPS